MGLPSWLRTPPIPTPLASQSISNNFSKLDQDNIGAVVRAVLRVLNDSSADSSHTKLSFFRQLVNGAAMALNPLTNRLSKMVKPWKLCTSPIVLGLGHSMMALTFSSSIEIPLFDTM
jgi:hypothetical protein